MTLRDEWTEVNHDRTAVPCGKEPWGDNSSVAEPTFVRKAYENDSEIRVIQKERVINRSGSEWYEYWIDVRNMETEQIVYSSSYTDTQLLQDHSERLMGLIDGIEQ